MTVDNGWLSSQFPDLSGFAELGRGGQKLVFSATHPEDGEVVLKLILPGQEVERVHREILAVSQVQCPRVPQILDSGTADTQVGPCVWLRETRVPGITLRERLQRGVLSRDEMLRLGHHLLEAVVAAEKVRIVHRDIKPENIMVDEEGNYWLLDFGVARHLDLESLTATAARFGVGTIGYSAPEQMRNVKIDINSRADLFAVGVVLYECAVGQNPFVGSARDKLEILRRVEQTPLPPLSLAWDSSGTFREFVATLTQKYPSRRPQTAHEAMDWLREISQETAGRA